MTTQADKDALLARLTKIQSVGGSLLSNATAAKKLAEAIDVADPAPDPVPDPVPEPTPEPTPDPDPVPAGGFPDATNTGVPAGVALAPYTGPARITTPTVIDGKDITVPLVIARSAGTVTIRNSRSRCEAYWNILNDEGATLVLEDVELDGMGNPANDCAVAGYNKTIRRCNIHGTIDGLKIGSNDIVEDTYIHDLTVTADSHNDGMQSLGSDDVLIRHNTVIMRDGATSAILLSTGSADSMKRIRIEDNLLGGGAFTVYGGYEAGRDVLSRVSDVSITGNRITTTVFPRGGAYGPFTSVDAPAVAMSANVWHDGPNAGQPAS
ncbi:right-handed parallel beta-helix repeat-containing protein [Actinotalea sp.]|uniref:right-handed parallel beta-helix repeat-containing protein n=1 Tax=Actinotalea sp. TaxID=1872145 RepID=UPI0035635E74